jgi:predicted Zn finger-like uncharacterized protein
MKNAFTCPGCGASGSVEDALIGKQVRCKQCNHRFAVPSPVEAEADGYSLVEPTRGNAGVVGTTKDTRVVFVPARGDQPPIALSVRKPRRVISGSNPRRSRSQESGFAWKTWLIRVGVLAAIALLATALFAPHGVVLAASAMLILGMAMVLVGYGAGAYGAFSEDFLYGLLYLVFPFYTAYYLVTRWEDLWFWFACSTAGVGLVLVGTQILRIS